MALVYDVGMHHGEDTTYYLSKGYSVVAIEAVPEFVESSAQRFQREIERGRLVILNVALADHAGTAECWVCDDLSEWSSFHETLAGRDDKNHHRITVNTTRFKDV